VLEQLRLLF